MQQNQIVSVIENENNGLIVEKSNLTVTNCSKINEKADNGKFKIYSRSIDYDSIN